MDYPHNVTTWSHGAFGPVTATLDWCEVNLRQLYMFSVRRLTSVHQANYQFSHYVAELANTFSNLFTIALAWYGAKEARLQSLPMRYILGYGVCSGGMTPCEHVKMLIGIIGYWSRWCWEFRVPRDSFVPSTACG